VDPQALIRGSSVKGKALLNPPTVHYAFSTTNVSGSSTGFDLVRQ
jgi:hypothetical protein